ncbi:MAG TPA: PAS domain S-box protein, partial [Bacteroidetes bacterium]|nr:PAS domain S-box protein [Bacteroidota bacterium]
AHYTLNDFTRRIHPDDLKERGLATGNWKVLKEGAYHSTYRLLVNGKTLWINAVGEVIYDKNGKPDTVIAAVQDITWQREKELELKQLELEREAIIRAIPDMIFVLNRAGIFLDFIPGINQEPLIPPEKFMGKKITEVLPPGIADKHFASLQKVFETQQVQVSEYTLEDHDGKPKYFEARFSPVNDNRAVVMVRDVTRRKEALLSLKRSNENLKLYSRALQESPASVVITDAQGIIQYVNKKFTENTGYTAREVTGKDSGILKSGVQDRDFYHRLWNTIQTGKIWHGEYTNRKKDGRLCWESATISPIYNDKREITHFIQVSEDITEKKKSAESVQKLAAIVDSSDAIIISKTLNGIILSWNRGAEQVYGYKAEEVIGFPINIIVPAELKKELQSFTQRIKQGKRVENFETRRICKDGTEVNVSLSLSGITDATGKLTGIAVVGQDITRQKQLERELIAEKEIAEKATRTKSLFLANMSHEIRTPLNAILGFSEILSKRLKDPVQKEYVESMHSSGKALLSLINDLLDLSKAEAGKMEFYRQSIDVRYLANDIESIFRLKARQKNLEFRVRIDKNVPHNLFLDELKIRQVLLNLTSNAIKFTEKGFVEIRLRAEQVSGESADLILEVKDTGKGIPPEYHEKIFKIFEQQNTSISKHYGGTGLGLAITQQIVTQMQGRIDVESTEGKGSLFRVYLPEIPLAAPDTPQKERTSPAGQAEIHFEPATVLIVDDTPNNRMVLRAALEEDPFRILEAGNGQEALKLLEKHPVDLIFMDIRMPVMDGLETVKIIREHKKWLHIPIVALTASSTEFDKKRFIQKGFDTYLRKPATLSEIRLVLMQHLRYDSPAATQTVTVELSEGAQKYFPEIEKKIQSELLPLQQKLTGIRPRGEVKKLAEKLIALGKQFRAEEIIRYGEKLHVANKNFLLVKEK